MPSVVALSDVSVRRGQTMLLTDVSLHVAEGERWVILGPNGAGKTTLMLILAAQMFPTSGTVELLDETPGATQMAELRTRIGWASSTLTSEIPPSESVLDVVMTGAHAVTGRWRERYEAADRRRAETLLEDWGLAALAGRTFGTLSEGERKRSLIARSLMADPELLLLDEPGAGLDLGGREDLVSRMSRLALDPRAPTQIAVTHHVEEIPEGFTHGLLLHGGRVISSGRLRDVLTDRLLTLTFGLPIEIHADDGRWNARRARA